VERLTTDEHRPGVENYRQRVAATSEEDRIAGRGKKSGVFIGAYATNPVNGERIPIWIADYVLLSYGTGAIMSVPGHDQRDLEFARQFGLPVRAVVAPPDEWFRRLQPQHANQGQNPADEPPASERDSRTSLSIENYPDHIAELPEAFTDDGTGMQSENEEVSLNGLPTGQAKAKITEWLVNGGIGHAAVKYKLRDWLFSRQRYWGEPIPILHELDSEGKISGLTKAVETEDLPVLLPEMEDFKPTGRPGGPLEKATEWIKVRKDGREYSRETNTMPQWAGSCWYYLRFCDPQNGRMAWNPEKERYWMPVDLYVGGAEHAVLHLLYSRFWHKVLFDRGFVTTMEPFQRLINQGMILSTTYRDSDGRIVPYSQINFEEGKALHVETGEELAGETEKMSKSRGNVIPIDVPIDLYGSDTTRLYEMFMGPLESTKPWNMQGVEGISRFLNRAWRMIVDEASDEMTLNPKVAPMDAAPDEEHLRLMHRTIKSVTQDMENLSFNTAISRLMEFVNYFTAQENRPRVCMENFVLLLSPMAPHIAEELWQTLGHTESLAFAAWPTYDDGYVQESTIEMPIQINGKVRARISVAADATDSEMQQAALTDSRVKKYLEAKSVRKVIVVPNKLISIVVG
jgi:leucyl-tRNA synthetase